MSCLRSRRSRDRCPRPPPVFFGGTAPSAPQPAVVRLRSGLELVGAQRLYIEHATVPLLLPCTLPVGPLCREQHGSLWYTCYYSLRVGSSRVSTVASSLDSSDSDEVRQSGRPRKAIWSSKIWCM
eukprot:COSAG02_NODE_4570_length_5209_cov_2.315656_3_plen_125_part_00